VDTETGELQERRLEHPEEAEKFYREAMLRQLRCFRAAKVLTSISRLSSQRIRGQIPGIVF
jgi:tRNA nucleotidyltransferase/poly(A) polymerase